ncbi:MAG: phospholipase D family protein [Alphaproteobacteria bacterium]
MAKKEFILQGFTTRTHLVAVRELFGISNIQRAILSVAFVSESGVDLLKAQVASCAAHVTVFAGIRNDITSRQGLGRLLGLGVKLYAVDTGSRNVLFHPKLYLVRSESQARVIVSSANLTIGGLNNNIEAGLAFEFDLADTNDKAIVDAIEARFDVLPKEYPDHVLKVSSAEQLSEMQASGRLVDEMAIPPPRPSTTVRDGGRDSVPRIRLKVVPLKKALAAAKKAVPKPTGKSKTAKGKEAALAPAVVGVEFELVWESKPLTRRDLTIPTAANTHATGSVNLDKGLLEESVDHRHYFRNEVFDALTWTATNVSGKVEETFAKFQLVLKGVSYGEFDLRIGHSTDKTSKMYRQKNAMTRLSWGPMRPYIARDDLIGRTLALYRDKADPTRFILEID